MMPLGGHCVVKRIAVAVLVGCLLAACSGKTKEELFAEAQKQLASGNPNGAVVLLKNALEKDQNFSDARFQLGRAYAAAGKQEQAEKEFRKVLVQMPGRAEARLELVKTLIALVKSDDALKEVAEYLKVMPNSPDGLEQQGLAHAQKRNFAEAEALLKQVLNLDPKRLQAKLELATIYVAQEKVPAARTLLEETIAGDPQNIRPYYILASIEAANGKLDAALELYRKIIAVKPTEVQALYRAGMIHLDRGEQDKAGQLAEQLLQKFPKNGEGARLKGMLQYQRKQYAEAITSLQNANKLQQTLEGYYYLGLSLYSKGDLETALSQFRAILDRSPNFDQARLMTGMILLSQKRVDDAIKEIRRVIEANDRNALAHNLLGSAYMAKGMVEEGMRELNRATQLDPKIIDAHLKKGIFYLSKGNQQAGETELATAVKVAPDVLNTRFLLASYYQRRGEPAKALSTLKAGLTGKQGDAALYNGMAGLMLSQRKAKEGLEYLQKAKQADPGLFSTYFNLATYYAATGQHDKAIAEYQGVLQKEPANVRALLGMAALNDLKGREKEALDYYTRAKETRTPAGFLALAAYYAKKKDTTKALNVLDEAIKADAKNAAALEMKGTLLASEKKFNDALKVFDNLDVVSPDRGLPLKIRTLVAMKEIPKAIEQARRITTQKPNAAAGYLVMASIYASQKDYPRAIAEVKNGIRVDAKNPQAHLELGNLLAASKNQAGAMAAYGDALKVQPNFAPALFAQGALLDATGKKKEAVQKYRDTLAKADNYVPALNNLAFLYADGYGSKDEALRLAISAFKLEPGNTGIMDTLGYALLRAGKKDDAKKVLDRAVTLLPGNPTVLYHLALAQKETNDRVSAAKSVQKALTLGEFPESALARGLMAELKR